MKLVFSLEAGTWSLIGTPLTSNIEWDEPNKTQALTYKSVGAHRSACFGNYFLSHSFS